ncbi:MAG: hypothetical protein HY744_30770 [Deltaproteobacteria bacterium]|nr:hypothetical protein [Deltaproteobacteria bacterium]
MATNDDKAPDSHPDRIDGDQADEIAASIRPSWAEYFGEGTPAPSPAAAEPPPPDAGPAGAGTAGSDKRAEATAPAEAQDSAPKGAVEPPGRRRLRLSERGRRGGRLGAEAQQDADQTPPAGGAPSRRGRRRL